MYRAWMVGLGVLLSIAVVAAAGLYLFSSPFGHRPGFSSGPPPAEGSVRPGDDDEQLASNSAAREAVSTGMQFTTTPAWDDNISMK